MLSPFKPLYWLQLTASLSCMQQPPIVTLLILHLEIMKHLLISTLKYTMPRPTRKKERPPYSYISLIVMAMLKSPHHMVTILDIYKFMMETFPYYQKKTKNWQNSVRHCLSINDCFVKLPRLPQQSNIIWTFHPR